MMWCTAESIQLVLLLNGQAIGLVGFRCRAGGGRMGVGGGGYCAEIRKGQGIDNNQHRGFT